MTADEYKLQHPENAHLEGEALWNAMENALLHQQEGDKVLMQIKPWWKRYKLRYLWYVKKRNGTFVTPVSCNERCKHCKRGASSMLFMMLWDENGNPDSKTYCMCGKELEKEPNTNWDHRWYIVKKWVQKWSWKILEATHLFRWSIDGRYSMFGDEGHYVSHWKWYDDGREEVVLIDRPWYEYIWIRRR